VAVEAPSRYWRWFGLALAGSGAAALPLLLIAPSLSALFLFLLWSIPSNSLLPIPYEPGLLYFAQLYPPLWVTAAGLVGAAISCTTDSALVEAALRHPRVRRAREGRVFQWAIRNFKRQPFWTVFLFSMVPLPVYVVRVLAPAAGYPLPRYTAAIVLGRAPGFYLVALVGDALRLPVWLVLAMLAAMVASALVFSRTDGEPPRPAADC
jgi:ribonucleoside-triphosphate reductase